MNFEWAVGLRLLVDDGLLLLAFYVVVDVLIHFLQDFMRAQRLLHCRCCHIDTAFAVYSWVLLLVVLLMLLLLMLRVLLGETCAREHAGYSLHLRLIICWNRG